MIKMPKNEREAIEMLREYRMANPRPLLPCVDQTEDDISAYYRAAAEGDVAVVRQGYGGMTTYFVGKITGKNARAGRVYVDCRHGGGSAFYMKHGRNCFHPKGQTDLIVPTPEVLAWAAEHPQGSFDFATFRGPEHGPAPARERRAPPDISCR
ncbi:hypothetical protein [Phreatobacter sp. AB_2022a]|uniref:hypothetical protein n=1 Tax=Phreatobacter sp. AB_2022a TaxID=3003134 RepID=UPI0022872F6F|nr:hypothetical protein [Phreatobacter sp. AB_2022a]MCZ0734510.1 hypothetical protein [Phreatobacter sp. AB_2022a]